MKDIILALVTRSMFAAHGLIGIWRAQSEWNRVELWLLLVPVALLIVEALFTVGIRGGEEYKWVSPCVLLYLGGVIPSIWLLEFKSFDNRSTRHYCNDLYWGKSEEPGCKATFLSATYQDSNEILSNQTVLKEACELEYIYLYKRNFSLGTTASPATSLPPTVVHQTTGLDGEDKLNQVVGQIQNAKAALDNLLGGVNIFTEATWILVLHQLLLFILIIGRWLLPTGEGISRDELSQLLLVFIGVGADILEFVTETVKEESVRCDRILIICIMGFWSWSTLQFTLVLTAAKARRTRAAGLDGEDDEESNGGQSPVAAVEKKKERGRCFSICTNMEIWGIMSTLILQDGPFLAMRLYIIFGRNVVHQMIVFFTFKNLLVVVLQIYRLAIIATKKKEEEVEEAVFIPRHIETVKTVALAKSKFAKGLERARVNKAAKPVGSLDKKSQKVAPMHK